MPPARFQAWRQRATRVALDAFLPPRCGGCDVICALETWHDKPFCETCVRQLLPLEAPLCPRCGAFYDVGKSACRDCGDVVWPSALLMMRSAFLYEGPMRAAIHRFKYGGQFALSEGLGTMLAAWCRSQPHDVPALPVERISLLVPVPMHPWRKWSRGFNQSELLAQSLAGRLNLPCEDALKRARYTVPQVSLDASSRDENVRDVFVVNERAWRSCRGLILDGTVLLIDDVCTTGATLRECAQTLIEAGAREVCVLTLARADTQP